MRVFRTNQRSIFRGLLNVELVFKKKPRGAGRGAPTNHARLPQTIGKNLWFVTFQSAKSSSQWFVQTNARKKVPMKKTQTRNKPLWSFFAVSHLAFIRS